MGERKDGPYIVSATREGATLVHFLLKDLPGNVVADGSGTTVSTAQQDALEKTDDPGATEWLGQKKYEESLAD